MVLPGGSEIPLKSFVAFNQMKEPYKKVIKSKVPTIEIEKIFVKVILCWRYSFGGQNDHSNGFLPMALSKGLEDWDLFDILDYLGILSRSFPESFIKIWLDLAEILLFEKV